MSSSPYDPTRFVRRAPDDGVSESVANGVEFEQPAGPVANATMSRYSEGAWFAPPAQLPDPDEVPRTISWKGLVLVIALGAAASQLHWLLGVSVFALGLALSGSLKAKVSRGRLISAAQALDRMESAPSNRHWLVRVRLVSAPQDSSQQIWSDVGGMAIEDDRLVFASPSTAFVIGGQDIALDAGANTFRLTTLPQAGWFWIDVLSIEGQLEATETEFRHRLGVFLSARPRTSEPRQLPPLRAFGP